MRDAATFQTHRPADEPAAPHHAEHAIQLLLSEGSEGPGIRPQIHLGGSTQRHRRMARLTVATGEGKKS